MDFNQHTKLLGYNEWTPNGQIEEFLTVYPEYPGITLETAPTAELNSDNFQVAVSHENTHGWDYMLQGKAETSFQSSYEAVFDSCLPPRANYSAGEYGVPFEQQNNATWNNVQLHSDDIFQDFILSEGQSVVYDWTPSPSPAYPESIQDADQSVDGMHRNDRRIRKKKSRFPIEAVKTLQSWLEKHQSNPYPDMRDKIDLSRQTGLDIKQIQTWFTNTRRRHPSPNTKAFIACRDNDEGYQYPLDSKFAEIPQMLLTNTKSSNLILHNSTSQNNGDKQQNANDEHEDNDKNEQQTIEMVSKPSSIPPFYCTFCHIKLSNKTWKRHEETQHLERHQWICLAKGFTIYRPSMSSRKQNRQFCIFCNLSNPPQHHEHSCHRIIECLHTRKEDRTYLRKDHLAQHLKQFHGLDPMPKWLAEEWYSRQEYEDLEWMCGFCGKELGDWDRRAKHIAKHFRQGVTMDMWTKARSAMDQLLLGSNNELPRQAGNNTDVETVEHKAEWLL
jgi:hypothetical protein